MTTQAPLTLRKLIELVGPDFMDAELSICMKDAHLNIEWALLPTDLSNMPRTAAHASTGEPARLMFLVHATKHRFVKARQS